MNPDFAKEADEAAKNIAFRDGLKMVLVAKKLYIGHEKREGWSGKLPFYLFFCFSCGKIAKDYPHGYTNYLLCPHCGIRDKLKPRDAYRPAE